ncbi:MAG: glutamate synthase large subunit [Bacteroidales bacterium]|jgi:glutamate synthase (NADPH/NADH) large chain|nr:glutamate synthase large subunit [Bacteroidales bacterium]
MNESLTTERICGGFPCAQGLYDPANERDNCGIGFVAHIKGEASHDIVLRGLSVLANMDHRGATSADNKTGDGAGILMQIPHEYFKDVLGIDLPDSGKYGTGLVFLPKDEAAAKSCLDILTRIIAEEGLQLIAIRDVPVEGNAPGDIAKRTEPAIKQVFVKGDLEQEPLERKLYIVRKLAEHAVVNSSITHKEAFYQPSFSSKVIVYKGMLTPAQLKEYYTDIQHEKFKSAMALVHSRFSTNTFPTWDLAQPFRFIAHNGEINTVKGNRKWMQAREALLQSDLLGEDLKKIFPVIEEGKSDSASFDNVLEFLHMTGRSLHHSLCMMIPESFNEKNPIPDSLKAFYEYHSTIMEPWDGPASMVFSDGRYIGGTLDRNGLRPSRYVITKNNMIVMGSEVGVEQFDPAEVKEKGRLRPGKIMLIDTKLGIIIPDHEVKAQLSKRNPYDAWLKNNRLKMSDISVRKDVSPSIDNFETLSKVFTYSREDMYMLIKGMATTAAEMTSSMGNDTQLAVFSQKPQRLFQYFKQVFAQVTNPAIDPIREGLVMSLTNYIGSVHTNMLQESPDHCRLIKVSSPLITNTDLGKIKDLKDEMFSHLTIPMLFAVNDGEQGFKKAFDQMLAMAEKAVDEHKNFIILSDRGVDATHAPIPSLLAVAAVHHHLIGKQKRMQIGIIVESAEPREVNHFALLLSYGASVINPYMVFAAIDYMCREGKIDISYDEAKSNYLKAIDKGLLKIMSKMGISTLRSYHGAQMYEAIGIDRALIDKYFVGTASRLSGIGLAEIAKESSLMHQAAYAAAAPAFFRFESSGQYAWRKYGEPHAWNPETIGLLQWATRTGDYNKYKEYSKIVQKDNAAPAFIRGCFKYKKNPIPLSEVEPASEIMKRFVTGAMSYGSISKEAHETMAIAMNTIGGRSNTGEGGEDPARFGTDKQSAIKQVASGRFGVTNNYLTNAHELQIKICQGAKPGEGGQLPGFKVNEIIARTRNSTPGITLISPPPHHDIYSIEDLAQLIYDLKVVNPRAKVSVKLVAEVGVGTVAAGVAKAHADLITISGGEGGTGASPASSIKHAGLPVEMGIAETQQTLVMNNLRGRVKLQVDGQIKNGRDVVTLACLGGEEFGFATSALIVMGCVMMRKCHLNTCPAGIATQQEALRKRFLGKAEYLVNFFTFIAEEIREIMAEMGVARFDELVGRTDLLEIDDTVKSWKMNNIDLSAILYKPAEAAIYDIHNTDATLKKVADHLDYKLIDQAAKAIRGKEKVWISSPIINTDRTIGAMLSGEISRRYGEEALPPDTINCTFHGTAGQSFGAFLVKGITFRLEGDSNDYIGKGLSGGKIIVVPPIGSTFVPEENIIIGNTTFYGATGGEAYIRGVAGERFCVRNSGAKAVVEGTGDHCCEYMTGGRVTVLGRTGRNFAGGMSGGIAYVFDANGDFDYYCNKGLVELAPVEDRADIAELQEMISNHLLYTQSSLAEDILTNWEACLPKFVKVIPFEYKKVLAEIKLREIEQKLRQAEEAPTRHE